MLCTEWYVHRASIDEGEPNAQENEGFDDTLEHLKRRVPEYIERHGRRKWQWRVESTPPFATRLPNTPPAVASRAYHKMREIALTCGLSNVRTSLHLAESPGGFVQATQQHAMDGWRWWAVSLDTESAPRPAVEVLPNTHGAFMSDLPSNGDLLDTECVNAVLQRLPAPVDLVTADGAVEMDHDKLEYEHIALLYAESNTALAALAEDGMFVCKFFEGKRYATRVWIAKMTTRFREVSIVKPVWSRATNSERYLVCRGFEGDASPLGERGRLSERWDAHLRSIVGRLCMDQTKALRHALSDN